MKTKLTTEEKTKISLVKATIADLSDQQEKLFNQLIKELNIVEPEDDDAIFDYVYNNYTNPSHDLWQQAI